MFNILRVLIGVAFFSVAQTSAFAQGIDHGALGLKVKLDKKVYKKGEPIHVDIILKNTSKEPLKLFHPDSVFRGWRNLEIHCLVTKPDGSQIILEPTIVHESILDPQEKDFRALKPQEQIILPVLFKGSDVLDSFPNSSRKSLNENDWEGIFPVSEDVDKYSIEEIRRKFNIHGSFGFQSSGQWYLVVQDLLTDVFNKAGQYRLKFNYKNSNNEFLEANKTTNRMEPRSLDGVWTGDLSKEITLEIVE